MTTTVFHAAKTAVPAPEVAPMVAEYRGWHQQDTPASVDTRKQNYATLVNHYYDLVTDFYEFGWGQSFHFAPRFKDESLADSLRRHEHYLALLLGLHPDDKVLDVGCGVGGPARTICRFTGAQITGLNNNAYQIERGQQHTQRAGLEQRCTFLHGDFMSIPAEDGAFDAAYAIEATCHAPERHGVFSEVYRVLQPGGGFAGYEWVLTERFDAASFEHQEIKKAIEEGCGIPNLTLADEVIEALAQAGFTGVEVRDLASLSDPQTPWYLPLTGKERDLRSLPRTRAGRFLSHSLVRLLERTRLAPRGATEVSVFLNRAADALLRGGELGIFTPLLLFSGRKPAR